MLPRTLLRSFVFSVGCIVAALPLLQRAVEAASEYRCPTGIGASNTAVVDTTCYAFYNTEVTWSAAKTACENIGGTLAAIRSATVQSAISAMAIGDSVDTWLGSTDSGTLIASASEGEFFWIGDASEFWTGGQGGSAAGGAYTNWATNEPNNSGSTEDCVELYRTDGKWNDMVCSEEQNYVCQLSADLVTVKSNSSARKRREQLFLEPTYTDTEAPTLQEVGIFLQHSTAVVQPRAENTSHAAAPDRIPRKTRIIQQLLTAPKQKPLEQDVPANRSTTNTSFHTRTCERVLKWFRTNQKMLDRVNERLEKRFGFTCS